MKKRILVFLMAIVFLGGFLRFWQLASHPVSLHIDEIAIGYNAYSILKTARDEHGQLMPLAFRSFGDFKAPVLIYLMTPALAVFGLNEFGTRFTLALVGTLTIIFVYLLTKELTKNEIVSLLASFSLAINPWHIQFSRATFEAILALFLMVIGVWLFLRAIRLKGKSMSLSALFFVLSMYSYHGERVVVPILVLAMAFIFRQKLWQYRKRTIIAVIVGLIALLPLFVLMLRPEGSTRAMNEFISRDHEIIGELAWSEKFSGILATVFNNKPLVLFNFWLGRYLDYWDLNFLFFDGTKLTLPDYPGIGLFHSFEIVLFLLGIWLVFFKGKLLKKESKKILAFWLLIGPLAASLAITSQHSLRSLSVIPAPQILIGFGGFWLFDYLKRQGLFKRLMATTLVILVISVSLIYYFDIYYLHFPIHFSEFWSYGMKEMSQSAWQYRDEYEEIVIDPKLELEGTTMIGAPYLYLLFYGKYDPFLFQNSPRRKIKTEDSVDFDKFTFREIYWPKDKLRKDTLFIGSPWVIPPDEFDPDWILKEIKFKNGRTAFLMVKT
ncbi:hypothetical protein AMJ51_00765 [Microgenomates bacterium DG_75]|nr:MAG: hypothetical protein AMJ51_00765 [Microgenomates bacterium DG_75]